MCQAEFRGQDTTGELQAESLPSGSLRRRGRKGMVNAWTKSGLCWSCGDRDCGEIMQEKRMEAVVLQGLGGEDPPGR